MNKAEGLLCASEACEARPHLWSLLRMAMREKLPVAVVTVPHASHLARHMTAAGH